MDLSVSTTSAAYLPMQAYVDQAAARGYATMANSDDGVSGRHDNRTSATRAELSPASPEADKAREEVARNKDPSAEASRSPGFKFEYEGSRQIMKVHNAKGALIYQVPSKGQLALIEAEGKASLPGQQLHLTA